MWIFLKIFKYKGMLLSFSFDSLLSRASRDVSTGSLARSVMADQTLAGHYAVWLGR